MAGFWDEINKDVNLLFGQKQAPVDDSGFPADLGSATSTPSLGDMPVDSGSAFSPDQAKANLLSSGYVPPDLSSKISASDLAKQFDLITNRSSAFNTVELDPAIDNGSIPGFANQKYIQNQQPPNPQTIAKIEKLLGVYGLSNRPVGVTYTIIIPGNSLKIERLSAATGNFPFQTAAVGFDYNAQISQNLIYNGLFCQFESEDSSLMYLKPGETYNLSFSKIIITTFGTAGRWRLIAGNNAAVLGANEDKASKAQLHLWDGQGILDNPTLQPVPISNTIIANSLGVNLGNATAYAVIRSNIDDGSKLVNDSNGNLVGSVTNNGYKIFWITGLTYTLKTIQAITMTPFYVGLGVGDSAARQPFTAGALFTDYFETAANAPAQYITRSITLAVPIRVILPGFKDSIVSTPRRTGTECFLSVYTLNNNFVSIWVSITGYGIPGLLNQNPYPQDQFLIGLN